MYGRGSSGYGSKSSQSSKQEANLMPVPSPQQIQYLNPLEGQELTIQKQPNTSLRDSDILSPSWVVLQTFQNNCTHSKQCDQIWLVSMVLATILAKMFLHLFAYFLTETDGFF